MGTACRRAPLAPQRLAPRQTQRLTHPFPHRRRLALLPRYACRSARSTRFCTARPALGCSACRRRCVRRAIVACCAPLLRRSALRRRRGACPYHEAWHPQAHHAFLHVAASQGAASFPSPPPGHSRASRKPAARAADLPAPPAGAPAGSHVGDAAQARRAASLPPARRFAARAALWAPLTRKP